MNESASYTPLNDPQFTTDSSPKIKPNQNNDSMSLSQNPGPSGFGLKLIFKRQHGDKYEIKNPCTPTSNSSCSSASSRPRREAARKVKFNFDESDESPVKKKPRNLPSIPRITRPKIFPEKIYTETCLPFFKSEIVEKSESLINDISTYQAKISINHSVPFPIALVEDKTNIVHTKALLLIHLYQSYSSQCIICVLCKNFFSIPDFSKHFHISEDDLDTDSSDDDLDQSSYQNFLSQLDERKDRKLRRLRKKSYKILPYFLNQNNELNDGQLKTWKLFSSKFTLYKSTKQKKLDELKENELKFEKEKLMKKKSVVLRPKSRRKIDAEMRNWDFINDEKEDKYFFANRNRLECEKIVYLKKNGQRLSDMESESDVEPQQVQKDNRLDLLKKSSASTLEPDLSLSEDEEDELKEKIPIRIYFYENSPSKLEKHFNYFENLSPEILNYMINDHCLIPNLSLVMFILSRRVKEKRNVLLAETNEYRLKWLISALDLDLGKS